MTIDLVCGAIGVRADQKKAIELAHRHGFESVAPDGGFLSRIGDADREDLLATLEEKRLVFGAAGLPVDFRRDEAGFRDGMKRLEGIAVGLKKAGVTRVGTWISPGHGSLTYVQNFKQHARRLREVAKLLSEHGLRFGLEYVGPKTSWTRSRHPFVHTMAETKDLIAEIGEDNMGFVLDSWHWYTAKETEADLLSLKNRDIVAVDLNDAPAGIPVHEQIDSRRELPAATGVIDLKTFLGALQRIGYDGPVRAEPFNAALRKLPPEEATAATARAMKKAFSLLDV
ncbi:MAG: sugar phosphate isomerase/epimerase [Planctomycetota bacterium]|nr:sugar phosphate isomerase/epimerase [Planctomycetota bacterium]